MDNNKYINRITINNIRINDKDKKLATNVALPDDGHWERNEFKKLRGGVLGRFRIIPVWFFLEELQCAMPYFTPRLSNEEMERRHDTHLFVTKCFILANKSAKCCINSPNGNAN
jgi:hypothetical protein